MKVRGYKPSRAILFGSFAKGLQHEYSDIDLAVWEPSFIGSISLDMVKLAPIKIKYPRIEFHTFQSNETVETNPFIEEILNGGITLEIP